MRSRRATDPPPAPISISSMTGTRMGSPEPFLKRSARATSNSRASSGSPRSITHAFAVVPPMSKESRRSSPACRAARAAARAPAAGPDSTSRTGTRLAVAGVAMPPEDSMM
jgi:hypothetical protein